MSDLLIDVTEEHTASIFRVEDIKWNQQARKRWKLNLLHVENRVKPV
jgi:hypothetical protein